MRSIGLIDEVLPVRCAVCARSLAPRRLRAAPLCAACAAGLEPLSGRRCRRCGLPLISEQDICMRCRERTLYYRRHRAVFRYEGTVREVIGAYKFGGQRRLAGPLADCLVAALPPPGTSGTTRRTLVRQEAGTVPTLVPIPASRRGRRARGFDQAALLARELSRRHGYPTTRLLARGRGREQKHLDLAARSRNLRGSLRLRSPAGLPKWVVLVDDVFTTGATVNECARILRAAGVAQVDAVTLAAD